jgi:hypothetical protein
MSEREGGQRDPEKSERGGAAREHAPGPLEAWTDAVRRELGLVDVDQGRATIDLVLDMARDVAHGVARPAAPLTAYLLGVAVGRARDPDAAVQLAARVTRLALDWGPPTPGGGVPATEGDRAATLRDTPAVESRDREPS